MSNFYAAINLIGGASGALDAIDGADLGDGDGAVVITSSYAYFYHLNATSGESESPPQIIAPDTNPGDKRWILEKVYGGGDSYVKRDDPPVYDWDIADFPADGTWTDLDCSGIVPEGAKAIQFLCIIKNDVISTSFQIKNKDNANDKVKMQLTTQGVNVYISANSLVGCDANRKVQYYKSVDMDEVHLVIEAWLI